MRISKCDNCKKQIGSARESMTISYQQGTLMSWRTIDLCGVCAQPSVALLRRKRLLPAGAKEIKRKKAAR